MSKSFMTTFSNSKEKLMKIIIAGASGFIGSKLVSFFQEKKDIVISLVRHLELKNDEFFWNPEKGALDPLILEGCDVLINLTGENISSGRWNKAKKERILMSRLCTTKTLTKTLKQLQNPPKVWLNASAIGFYGDRAEKLLTEENECGQGFLADVCRKWEAAAKTNHSTRLVYLRTGVVLGNDGGILKRLWLPFKLGLGGMMGSGKQYMSWIAIQDFIHAIDYLIQHDISGAVNMTAPNPVTNFTFTKTLGKRWNRPTFLSIPTFLLRLVFGEMADEMFLNSTRAIPQKLQESGYVFKYPKIEKAFQNLLKR